MNLQSKLIASFAIVAAIPLVGGGIGLYAHRDASRSAQVLLEAGRTARALVDRTRGAEVAFKVQIQEWKNILLRGHDPAAYERHFAGFTRSEQAVQSALADSTKLAAALNVELVEVDALRQAHTGLGASYRAALARAESRRREALQAADTEVSGNDRELARQLDALVATAVQRTDAVVSAETRRLEHRGRMLQWLMGVGTIVGVLLGAAFGWLTSHDVSRHVRTVARRMWDGTLGIAAASAQVASSSQNAARASGEQAAALEESAAVLTEVNAAVKQNAAHASTAREISTGSRRAADASAAEMSGLQTAMEAIGSASANIARIVKSIDEIAFQTNLLALNAAVEAARAGEAGAGFAVVADEVRNLAQRSAQAARETAQMIQDATDKSARGEEIAKRVGNSLHELIENTRRTDELIAQIAAGSNEQASGLDQAVASTAHMDRLTQDNAATAEQTATAAQQLDQQMRQLRSELSLLLGQSSTEVPGADATATASAGAVRPRREGDVSEPVARRRGTPPRPDRQSAGRGRPV